MSLSFPSSFFLGQALADFNAFSTSSLLQDVVEISSDEIDDEDDDDDVVIIEVSPFSFHLFSSLVCLPSLGS